MATTKPISRKRKALLAAAGIAIVGMTGLNAFKTKNPNAPPTAPIITATRKAPTAQPPKPPSGLTWEDAIKRIEEDAKERKAQRDAGMLAEEKPKFEFSEREIFEEFKKHEVERALLRLRTSAAVDQMEALPVLDPRLFAEINEDFEYSFLQHIRGQTNARISTTPFSEILANIRRIKALGVDDVDEEENRRRDLFGIKVTTTVYKRRFFEDELQNRGYKVDYSGKSDAYSLYTNRDDYKNKRNPAVQKRGSEIERYWREREGEMKR